MDHPHKTYPNLLHLTKKFGGQCHTRLEASAICRELRLSFQRPSLATLLLSHIIDYLTCTIND